MTPTTRVRNLWLARSTEILRGAWDIIDSNGWLPPPSGSRNSTVPNLCMGTETTQVGIDGSDAEFAYIAGYTSGGVPYGIRYDEPATAT
jgi:hypothetical protein